MVREPSRTSALFLRGAHGRRAPVDLDAGDFLEPAAVEGEHLHVLLDHVAHEDRLAVGREGGALRPVADRRLGDLRQLHALRAQDHELAVVRVERRLLRLVAAVHHHHRDVPAVGRDLDALRRLADAVPSLRVATSASVPWRLIEMPAALLPASSVVVTAGGDAFRSMADTRVSGTVLVGSLGSTLLDEPTSARLSSGVRATLRGGPTTLPGAAISATNRGGEALRSMIVTVSGRGFGTIFTVPLSSMTLLSFDVTASCAGAEVASASTANSTRTKTRRWAFMSHLPWSRAGARTPDHCAKRKTLQ